ncbi:PREDICTED: GRAM domain-containing protein 1B-like isoform X2 [Dinoponera quadriceps]|uniref:GRAM domain-containing protein 1B-like isoform X2 n=1 Tax=Dinoponera quadriceps TaxID=609295 RepID=A0A6P3WYE8_DINQU|nr:PREDICTED: GRAM domain-containing protein 1B-like isoform X2 [Dinoponera quadriceps]
MNKSVENLLISSHEVINSINSSNLGNQNSATNLGSVTSPENVQETHSGSGAERNSPVSSPNLSPRPSPRAYNRREYSRLNSDSSAKELIRINKSEDQLSSQDQINRSSDSTELGKSSAHESKKESRASDRAKKKSSWYNVLYPTYKSRSEDFRRIFKDVPDDERLVVDYSCALQREILVHGRLYVSQNYVCFYANIFMWETLVSLRWKDVTSITKEKTALVIPNAILICTITDKFFLTSFGARDKTYVMLFRVWQNALIGEHMSMAEMWQLVHACYGDELGLTSDDEDYVPPLPATDEEKLSTRLSVESFSEAEVTMENTAIPAVDPAPAEPAELQPVVQPPQLQPQPLPRSEPVLDPTDLSDTTESEAEKHGHLIQSAWTQNTQTDQKMRTLSYTISLSQALGPRTCHVTETQVMLPCSRPGHLYCIDIESINAGIPYADSFSVSTHYCIHSISENETGLMIFSQIKYKKNVWSFVKSMIEKNCWAGLEEYFDSLTKALTVECEEGSGSGGLKRKTRKRRRATGVGATLQTHASEHMAGNHQISPSNSSHAHAITARSDTNMILSTILLIAVLCLMVINGLLYYKLWGLEEAAAYTIMDLHVLKNTPKTEEDWINLLQQQESLHNVEMRKWQRVLHTAAQLLRQTEESLTELQMSIHPTATEKMFSVLKPNLKSVDSRTERRSKTEM